MAKDKAKEVEPKQAAEEPTEQAVAPAVQVALVKMRRNLLPHESGPTTADVHPDEVGNYQNAGWSVAPADKPPVK